MEDTLKQWRAIRGLSQTELAESIGKTQITVSNWETGKSDPRYRDMLKLREALALEPTDVILMPGC